MGFKQFLLSEDLSKDPNHMEFWLSKTNTFGGTDVKANDVYVAAGKSDDVARAALQRYKTGDESGYQHTTIVAADKVLAKFGLKPGKV